MDKSLDQRIHEDLLGLCWHYFDPNRENDYCQKDCGFTRFNANRNLAYSTDGNAMLKLIEAMQVKGYGYVLFKSSTGLPHARFDRRASTLTSGETIADTLPMAVALAADKVREMEVK